MGEIENIATVTVAMLDNNGVFLGVETIPEGEAGGRVQVPPDIDLKEGAYKWHAENGQFLPIPIKYPSAEKALYDGLRTLIDAGMMPIVPASVSSWIDFVAKKNGW